MPNWACADFKITGTREGVTSMIQRFVSDDEPRTVPGKKSFARSFLFARRQDILDMALAEFHTEDPKERATVTIGMDFAWSAYSCLISGYPQTFEDTCITLVDACREDQVAVEINTEEPGLCFTEHITCDPNGNLTCSCEDLPPDEDDEEE